MKKISEYNIPNHYIEIIEKFYNFLLENYKERVLLFTLSGSTVFENIVENISDIDYILILKECSPDDYRRIYQYKNQFDIKIGGSIFTESECKYKQIDYLAMYYLYLINIGNIEPIYMSSNFSNDITKNDMLESIRNVVILNLRTLKKMVYSRNIKDIKLLMKNILFLEKDFLILNDLYCKSKNEIMDKFNEMFNLKFDLSIIDCLNNNLSND
ncbi:MAG: hypothetical protein J6D28_04120 [Bacilli bacterium]|nr:hypothetical protein [Bacilli bacterium]